MEGLVAYITRQAYISKPLPESKTTKGKKRKTETLYDLALQVEKTTGKFPKEYEPLPQPPNVDTLLQIFWEIRGQARIGFNGPERISYQDMYYYMKVRRVSLPQIIIDLLLILDAAYLEEWYRT